MVRVLITIVTPMIIMIGSVFFFTIYYAIKEGIKLFSNAESLAVQHNTKITITSFLALGFYLYLKPFVFVQRLKNAIVIT